MSADELQRVLAAVVEALQLLDLPYHVTGGLASSFYGEPRFTQDVDFVIRSGFAQGDDGVGRLIVKACDRCNGEIEPAFLTRCGCLKRGEKKLLEP